LRAPAELFGNNRTSEAPSLCPQYPERQHWSEGTADSVRQFLWILNDVRSRRDVSDIIICPADQLVRTPHLQISECPACCSVLGTVRCKKHARTRKRNIQTQYSNTIT